MNLYLIGFRCCGKSAVGGLLAKILSWDFLDMDDILAARFGSSISEMVSAKGWHRFRKEEKRLVAQISEKGSKVVATGGGVILDPANVASMKASGSLLWLQVDATTAAERMAADERTGSHRPALTEKPFLTELADTLAERIPLYASAADFVVETSGRSANEVCGIIVEWLETSKSKSGSLSGSNRHGT